MGLLQEEELLVNRIATRFWAERSANGTDENENLKPPDFVQNSHSFRDDETAGEKG